MNDKARDVIGEVIAEDSVRIVPPSVAQHAVQSIAELQEVTVRRDTRIEELELEIEVQRDACIAAMRRAEDLRANAKQVIAQRDARIAELQDALIQAINARNCYQWEFERVSEELAALKAQQPAGVVLADQDGSNAQVSFWAGFEAAVCGLHGVNIRTAWNEFKASDQFARLNACQVSADWAGERAAFEREAVERYGYTWASIYSRRQGLGYSDPSLCMAWIMWQARAALAGRAAVPVVAEAGPVELKLTKEVREFLQDGINDTYGGEEFSSIDAAWVECVERLLKGPLYTAPPASGAVPVPEHLRGLLERTLTALDECAHLNSHYEAAAELRQLLAKGNV